MTGYRYYFYITGIIMTVKKPNVQEVLVMIKVNILNLSGFLETVNQCRGRVMVLAPGGERINITRQYPIQREMEQQYRQNGNCLPLSLVFEEAKDYLAVVCYYAGDC